MAISKEMVPTPVVALEEVKQAVELMSAPKTMNVTLAGRQPEFTFEGPLWSARDVRIILRGIVRAYRQYQQAERRKIDQVLSEQSNLSAKG